MILNSQLSGTEIGTAPAGTELHSALAFLRRETKEKVWL